jgi:hypothetical protein
MGRNRLVALLAVAIGFAALVASRTGFFHPSRPQPPTPALATEGLPLPPVPPHSKTPPPAPSPAPPDVGQVEPPAKSAPPDSDPARNEGLIHAVSEPDDEPSPSASTKPASFIHEVGERAIASSNGDVHFRTGDGAYYDLQLVGEFIALKSTSDDLEVQARQAPWQGTSRSVSTNAAVAINVVGDRVGFYAGPNGGLHVNGQLTAFPGDNEAIELPQGGRLAGC